LASLANVFVLKEFAEPDAKECDAGESEKEALPTEGHKVVTATAFS
jgi:hypothetical protein